MAKRRVTAMPENRSGPSQINIGAKRREPVVPETRSGPSRINIVAKRRVIATPETRSGPSQINIGAKRHETVVSVHTSQEVKRHETAAPEKGQLAQIH